MKKSKIESPISLMLVIVDYLSASKVEDYLHSNHLEAGIMFKGEGTAESTIADIFGFGLDDKSILACVIPNDSKSKILEDITRISGVENDKYGLVMAIKIDSASSNFLENLKIKVDN